MNNQVDHKMPSIQIRPLITTLVDFFTLWKKTAGKFVPEDLDPTLCTHVIYAFSVLDEKTHTLKIFDEDVDVKQSK